MNFSVKTTKIIFWISTILLFIANFPSGFMVTSPEVVSGFQHLGITGPWFYRTLEVGKSIGALILILPFIKGRVKEWVYSAFGIDFIAAFIAIYSVDGFGAARFVLIFIAVLLISYTSYHSLNGNKMPLY